MEKDIKGDLALELIRQVQTSLNTSFPHALDFKMGRIN